MSDNASLPPFASWPSFPFEGDLRLKPVDDPVSVEPSRHGENPEDCRACNAPDEAYIWVSERWRVRSLDRPTGLPVVLILEPRSHLDLGDLPNLLAAELGVMTVRVERAIRSLEGVARVHVNRWGDGAAHLHIWFLARPYGHLQLQGTFLTLWNDILPTIPEEQWRDNLALVAAWLAEFGGRPLAEPTRIRWTAPARFESTDVGLEPGTDPLADSGGLRSGSVSSTADLSDSGDLEGVADTASRNAVGRDSATPSGVGLSSPSAAERTPTPAMNQPAARPHKNTDAKNTDADDSVPTSAKSTRSSGGKRHGTTGSGVTKGDGTRADKDGTADATMGTDGR